MNLNICIPVNLFKLGGPGYPQPRDPKPPLSTDTGGCDPGPTSGKWASLTNHCDGYLLKHGTAFPTPFSSPCWILFLRANLSSQHFLVILPSDAYSSSLLPGSSENHEHHPPRQPSFSSSLPPGFLASVNMATMLLISFLIQGLSNQMGLRSDPTGPLPRPPSGLM